MDVLRRDDRRDIVVRVHRCERAQRPLHAVLTRQRGAELFCGGEVLRLGVGDEGGDLALHPLAVRADEPGRSCRRKAGSALNMRGRDT